MLEIYILWAVRVGAILLLLGIFLPNKSRRTILSKVVGRKPASFIKQSGLVKALDKVTENSTFRPFMLKPESDDFVKLEDSIAQAGGLGGLTPNIVQLFKIILPPIAFVIAFGSYIVGRATKTMSVNPTDIQLAVEEAQITQGFLTPQVSAVPIEAPLINPIVVMWIFIGCLLLYMLPEYLIRARIKTRHATMRKELPIMGTFIVIMLESGTHTVYDILKTLLETSDFFRPYLSTCLNEYYVDPKRAIQNMADRIQDEEFQVLCNSLKQAVDMDKQYTVAFMKQHLDQIKKMQDLQREASIRKKPLAYVFLLALPLISVVIIWFYPWFEKSMKMLTNF